MITRAGELRHRLRFAAWTLLLRLQLRRRGARLVLEAPHGARLDSWPHLDVHQAAGALTLRLGRRVRLGREMQFEVQGGGSLELGDDVHVMNRVLLQLRGGSITIGPRTHVRDGALLKADGELTVGEDATISYGVLVACTERVSIGDRAGLAERVTVIDSDHSHDGSEVHFLRQPLRVTPVTVGDNVFVCANVVVLRGARVGPGAVIAAGAVVGGGDHAAGWLHAGVPAKPVRALS